MRIKLIERRHLSLRPSLPLVQPDLIRLGNENTNANFTLSICISADRIHINNNKFSLQLFSSVQF